MNFNLYKIFGIILIFVVWQILSVLFHFSIPSPFLAIKTLMGFVLIEEVWFNILVTLKRIIIGILISSFFGLLLGILAGINNRIKNILEPLRWVTMTTPDIIIIIIGVLVFGLGGFPVIFTIVVIITPLMYVSIMEGVRSIDKETMEMCRIFKVSKKKLFMDVYIPAISYSIISALMYAFTMGVRIAIMAEFISASKGVGNALYLSWTYLEKGEVFAWAIISLILAAFMELIILNPVEKRLLRWKSG
ncbi:MAG: ABC transporter permease subunit [Desulfurellaceae bacterium]|jgi:NitT/TauT family transport system permease protein|nr:ABC transporter permease subunit [Desulfurellaceae bacterium]